MFYELMFLHFSTVVFIVSVLILYLRLKNKILLVMLLSMMISQGASWLPLVIEPESKIIYDAIQYTQLIGEIITAIAFFVFALSFKCKSKATKKAKTSSK